MGVAGRGDREGQEADVEVSTGDYQQRKAEQKRVCHRTVASREMEQMIQLQRVVWDPGGFQQPGWESS
jgi:hypothetical protein